MVEGEGAAVAADHHGHVRPGQVQHARAPVARRGPQALVRHPVQRGQVMQHVGPLRQAVLRRIYPSRKDAVGVALFSNGGPASVTSLEAWQMMPSNPY